MLIVANLMELVVNPIFCDESFCVIMTLKFWPPGHAGVLTEVVHQHGRSTHFY